METTKTKATPITLSQTRMYVTKSKAGHYWATIRSKVTGEILAKSIYHWGSKSQAKAEALETLGKNPRFQA